MPVAKHGELKIVTINVPRIDLNYIQQFMDEGLVPSRSEYIRNAIRNQINADFETVKYEKRVVEGTEKRFDPKKFVRVPGYNGNEPVKIVRRLEY